ncbi:hypothetical protein LCGC14_2492400 [marine sediment metagenome]|uniref:Uncharacterized protein n=1 Tax=marine sediment metagenome TaxID=412755 RepID=A0A0F9DG89_9ZZZZ
MKYRVVYRGQVISFDLNSLVAAEEIRERLRLLHGWDCCIQEVKEVNCE